eukprot:720321-Pyramimonas_sp.AAC.1
MVVQGFKDKSLGEHRRDAPTASKLAEAMVLLVIASTNLIMSCGDVKNAYFLDAGLDVRFTSASPEGDFLAYIPDSF